MVGSSKAYLSVLFAVALVCGGGGVGAGFGNLVVQLVALLILGLRGPRIVLVFQKLPRVLQGLLMLTLALPLVQLIPLPPVAWHALAGRDLVRESLALVGEADTWRPITVSIARTVVAFLGLVPFIVVLALAIDLRDGSEFRLRLVVAGGLLIMALGLVQLASSGTAGMLYSQTYGEQALFGVFANRNTTGLYLVLALTALVASAEFSAGRSQLPNLMRLGLGIGFMVGVVLTQSRSAMALVVFPVGFLAWRILAASRGAGWRPSVRLFLGVAVACALAIILCIGLLSTNARLAASLQRFDELQDARLLIWEDTSKAVARYWPVGAGMGTFDEVYQVDESLEYLKATRAGRAHDEALELALEAGIVGLALLLGWLAWFGAASWRVRSDPKGMGASIMLATIAFQSILDYPLRSEALMCTAALLLAGLLERGTGGA